MPVKWIIAFGVVSGLSIPVAEAQRLEVGFAKGDTVVLAIPFQFIERNMGGALGTVSKYDIDVRSAGSDIEVRLPGKDEWTTEWRAAGFPPGGRYNVGKLKTVDREGQKGKWIEVTLQIVRGVDYRIFAPVGQPEAIRRAVIGAAAADSVRRVAYASLGAVFFTGPLESFDSNQRDLILTFAQVTAQGTKISSEIFKDRTYFVVSLPGDGNTWNNLRVTRSERVGRLIGAQLPLLKAFAKLSVPIGTIGGLKLEQPSTHGTAPGYNDVVDDAVEAYFPLDLLLQFANADITSQALLNGSIVLVNDDRVEVDLSSQ